MADALLTHAFISAKPAAADATKIDGPKWNAQLLFSGGSDGEVIVRSAASATGAAWSAASLALPAELSRVIVSRIVQDAPVGTVGSNAMGFGDVTFSGIHDPLMWWGYNQQGGPGSHPRFFWELEGNFFDGVNTWAETYIQRYDTVPGTGYRPFMIGTYDGFASGAFRLDNFSIAKKDGTGAVMDWDTAAANVQLGAGVDFLAQGNNRWPYKQVTTTPGSYVGLIGLNASNQVTLGEGDSTVTLSGPFNASGNVIGFGAAGINDVGFARAAAGVVNLGTGAAGSRAGTLRLARMELFGDRIILHNSASEDVFNLYGSGAHLVSLFASQADGTLKIADNGNNAILTLQNPDGTFLFRNMKPTTGYTYWQTQGGDGQAAIPLGRYYSAAGVVGTTVNADGSFTFALPTTLGSYLAGAEQTAPAAPAANGYRLYAEDSAGKTRLMCLFATGAAQQVALQP